MMALQPSDRDCSFDLQPLLEPVAPDLDADPQPIVSDVNGRLWRLRRDGYRARRLGLRTGAWLARLWRTLLRPHPSAAAWWPRSIRQR
jgi:hypothetical protein